MKKILYRDMDNVLVDFPPVFPHLTEGSSIVSLMQPMPDAVDAFAALVDQFET